MGIPSGGGKDRWNNQGTGIMMDQKCNLWIFHGRFKHSMENMRKMTDSRDFDLIVIH